MNKKQIASILEKLKEDENYYGEFGQQFLSNSNIRTLAKDPLKLLPDIVTVPANKPISST